MGRPSGGEFQTDDRADSSPHHEKCGRAIFTSAVTNRDGRLNGNPRLVQLAYASDTPIRRHRKIRAAANPFDPQWESYFEERLNAKKKDYQRG